MYLTFAHDITELLSSFLVQLTTTRQLMCGLQAVWLQSYWWVNLFSQANQVLISLSKSLKCLAPQQETRSTAWTQVTLSSDSLPSRPIPGTNSSETEQIEMQSISLQRFWFTTQKEDSSHSRQWNTHTSMYSGKRIQLFPMALHYPTYSTFLRKRSHLQTRTSWTLLSLNGTSRRTRENELRCLIWIPLTLAIVTLKLKVLNAVYIRA